MNSLLLLASDLAANSTPATPPATTQSATTLPAFDYNIWVPGTNSLIRLGFTAAGCLLVGILLMFLFRRLAARLKITRTLIVFLLTLTLYISVFSAKTRLFVYHKAEDPFDPILFWFNRTIAALLLYAFLRFIDRLILIPILSHGGKIPVARFVHQIINIVIALFALVIFGSVAFDWNISTFLAGSAVVSIVLGLALQETLGNFFSGLVLQASPPFALGHFITIGEYEGRIVDMTWRAVTLHTTDDNFIVIPNATIAKAEITNYHAPSTACARTITIGLDPDVEPAAVLEALTTSALETPGVLANPAPKPWILEFTNTGITYSLKFWINDPAHHKDIEHLVRLHLWYRLAERNIPIPIPSLALEHIPSSDKRKTRESAACMLREKAFSAVPLLQPLSSAQLQQLAAIANDVSLAAGQILFRQNDPGDSVYVIRKGTAEVLINQESSAGAANAPALKKVATLKEGDFFGEMSALTGQPRTATIRALSSLTLIQIEKRDLQVLFEADASIMEKISAVVADRNAHREAFLAGLTTEPPPEMLATQQNTLLSRMKNFFRITPKK